MTLRWWTDKPLLALSARVVFVNDNDAHAWAMRGEVLTGLFGQMLWPQDVKRTAAYYEAAEDAFKRAAEMRPEDETWCASCEETRRGDGPRLDLT